MGSLNVNLYSVASLNVADATDLICDAVANVREPGINLVDDGRPSTTGLSSTVIGNCRSDTVGAL